MHQFVMYLIFVKLISALPPGTSRTNIEALLVGQTNSDSACQIIWGPWLTAHRIYRTPDPGGTLLFPVEAFRATRKAKPINTAASLESCLYHCQETRDVIEVEYSRFRLRRRRSQGPYQLDCPPGQNLLIRSRPSRRTDQYANEVQEFCYCETVASSSTQCTETIASLWTSYDSLHNNILIASTLFPVL